jgi:hypothetical protein
MFRKSELDIVSKTSDMFDDVEVGSILLGLEILKHFLWDPVSLCSEPRCDGLSMRFSTHYGIIGGKNYISLNFTGSRSV